MPQAQWNRAKGRKRPYCMLTNKFCSGQIAHCKTWLGYSIHSHTEYHANKVARLKFIVVSMCVILILFTAELWKAKMTTNFPMHWELKWSVTCNTPSNQRLPTQSLSSSSMLSSYSRKDRQKRGSHLASKDKSKAVDQFESEAKCACCLIYDDSASYVQVWCRWQ